MIKNYFKTAFRGLWKNKLTATISLFGLAIGMTAAVFIFLWVQTEINYDDYHPGKENIYRVSNDIEVSKDETWYWENSPMLLAEAAKKEIPEVEEATRVVVNIYGAPVFNINNKLFSEKTTAWVDNKWFNVFHYDFVAGNANAFNQNPFSIILTEAKAKKYFGNENAVGKVIAVGNSNYTVQAVVKNNPVNSSFQFDVLLQMAGRFSDPKLLANEQSWNNFNYISFVRLRNNASEAKVTAKLNSLMQQKRPGSTGKTRLLPLNKMYFETGLQSSSLPHGNKKMVYVFGILAVMILITACINYVNLTTARASLRSKEVGVRKIVGAQKKHLFFQFIIESLCISFIAVLITLVIIQLCLPGFNLLTEKNYNLPIFSSNTWLILAGTLFLATILNGIYPALMLSSFNPMNVFRGKSVLKMNDVFIRKSLVVFQFGLSIILIVGVIVIFKQLKFIQSSGPGYNLSQVVSLQIPYRSYASFDEKQKQAWFASMKNELSSQSLIASVSLGGDQIENIQSASSGNADWDGRDTLFNPTIAMLSVDTGFKNMFGLKLKEGHWFRDGKIDQYNIIVNETAANAFNMRKPLIGQRITVGGDTGMLIGIVKDFHFKSMHEKIGPMVISNNMGIDSYFFVKILPGKTESALAVMEKTWNKFIPKEPFEYSFLDESFARLYKSDIKSSQLMQIFSIIAVIISSLGLFALAAFTADQRTKEIGIRKVLGASVNALVILLSKDFIKLVFIALLIACPLAGFFMNKWLEDFAYRIDISWWIFLFAGLIAIAIALVTVCSQAIKAALANPVKNLRTE